MFGRPRQALGISLEGSEIKIAQLMRRRGKVSLSRLRTIELRGKTDEEEEGVEQILETARAGAALGGDPESSDGGSWGGGGGVVHQP